MNVKPDDDDLDMTTMIIYNIHDAYLHIKVALNTRCIEEICTMCSVFKSPIADVTRFISGTVVCSMAASFALSLGLVIDWSVEGWEEVKYKGAYVLSPVTGFHSNVTVLDFASMYPSIMIGANISPETIHRVTDPDAREFLIERYDLRRPKEDGDVAISWTDKCVLMRSSDVIFIIDRTEPGITRMMCEDLIAQRRLLPNKNSPEGWTLKIGTNSIYGVFGASTSGLSCKLAAIAVTAIGRFLLRNLVRLAEENGLNVLYGDTDSVFVKRTATATCNETDLIGVYHDWSRTTPFEAVKLEHDKTYSGIILVRPKIYYGWTSGQGTPVMKGMASKRRDRPDVARHALRDVCDAICSLGDDGDTFAAVSEVIYRVVRRTRQGNIDPLICMRETKVEGIIMYAYKGESGDIVYLDRSKFDGTLPEAIDVEWVTSSIESSLSSILEACHLPPVTRIIEIMDERIDDIEDLV
ncbi:unnamed protein product [Peronospora belbahrii]|nr:unnamed protein product [Peronospora belbahrii]